MQRMIINVFKVMGSLLLGLLLWRMVIGGQQEAGGKFDISDNAFQRGMWTQGSSFVRSEWDNTTGSNGRVNRNIRNSQWGTVEGIGEYDTSPVIGDD